MKISEIDSWTLAPIGGASVYNPSFRNKTTEQIISNLNIYSEWLPFGYNHFIICRSVATVFIERLSINH